MISAYGDALYINAVVCWLWARHGAGGAAQARVRVGTRRCSRKPPLRAWRAALVISGSCAAVLLPIISKSINGNHDYGCGVLLAKVYTQYSGTPPCEESSHVTSPAFSVDFTELKRL